MYLTICIWKGLKAVKRLGSSNVSNSMQKYTCVDHVMHRNNVPTINYYSAQCPLLLKALCVRTKERPAWRSRAC